MEMDPLLICLSNIRPSETWTFMLEWLIQNNETDNLILFSACDTFKHLRPDGYCEEWLPQYLEYDFFQLFRMGRESFQKLLRKLLPAISVPNIGGEIPILVEKRLMMALWWLGKGEVHLSVADKFNVAISAVYKNNDLVLHALLDFKCTYIIWPTHNEIEIIENDYRARGNIPGVVGAIHVCNIPFKAPAEQQESYIDRKMQHSIKLQGICTANKIFTNVFVGWPGSVHDSRVFQNCDMYQNVTNNINQHKYFPTLDHHLVGDSAYPLLHWIITPYRDNGNLAPWQRRYNYLHSKTRMVIEHSFGLLKGRWRILNYINVNSVKKAVKYDLDPFKFKFYQFKKHISRFT